MRLGPPPLVSVSVCEAEGGVLAMEELLQSRLTREQLIRRAAALGAALPVVGLAAGWRFAGSDNGITATYMKSGTYNVAAQSLLKQFTAKTGIKVSVLAFPFAILEQKNQTDLVTQTGQYDVLSNSSWDIAFFQYLRP